MRRSVAVQQSGFGKTKRHRDVRGYGRIERHAGRRIDAGWDVDCQHRSGCAIGRLDERGGTARWSGCQTKSEDAIDDQVHSVRNRAASHGSWIGIPRRWQTCRLCAASPCSSVGWAGQPAFDLVSPSSQITRRYESIPAIPSASAEDCDVAPRGAR